MYVHCARRNGTVHVESILQRDGWMDVRELLASFFFLFLLYFVILLILILNHFLLLIFFSSILSLTESQHNKQTNR